MKIRDRNGRIYEVELEGNGERSVRWGKWYRKGRYRFALIREGKRAYLFWEGMLRVFEIVLEGGEEERGGTTTSPITGRITSIKVKEGQRVRRGDPILTIESMKMETVIEAPSDGVIEKIYHSEGDLVDQGAVLFEISEE